MADDSLTNQKKCRKCRLIKPLDLFRSSVHVLANGEKKRYYNECKDCHAEYIRSRPVLPLKPATGEFILNPRIPVAKNCRVCGELKPVGDFYTYKYTTNQGKLSVRLDGDCKACNVAQRSQAEARVKENARQRSHRRSRPEVHQAYLAKRRAEDKLSVTEKRCRKCKEVKPAAEFYERLVTRDGLHSQCRACVIAVGAAYVKTIDPKRRVLWMRKALLKAYGMTLEQYEEMAASQNGACLICLRTEVDLCVDHCHNSTKVRGLLCKRCNAVLGFISESKETALRLAEYIDKRCGTSYV